MPSYKELRNVIRQSEKLANPNIDVEPNKATQQLTNVIVDTSIGMINQHLNSSARRYQNSIAIAEKYAESGEDFIKRVDTEINPQYKKTLMFSQAAGDVYKNVPLQAQAIDEHNAYKAKVEAEHAAKVQQAQAERAAKSQQAHAESEYRKIRNLEFSLALKDISENTQYSSSFEEFSKKANEVKQEVQSKYGNLTPEFVANYNHILNSASKSYANADRKNAVVNYSNESVNTFIAAGDISPESVENFIDNNLAVSLSGLTKGEQNEVMFGAMSQIVSNMGNLDDSMRVINHSMKYLNSYRIGNLRNIARQASDHAVYSSDKKTNVIAEQIAEQHALGRPVDPNIPMSAEQKEINSYLEENYAIGLSPEEMMMFDNSIMDKVALNFVTDFNTDFVRAVEKRYPEVSIKPVIIPTVVDDQIVGRAEFMQSLADRALLSDQVDLRVGGTNSIGEIFSYEETLKAQKFFKEQDDAVKLEFGLGIAKSLKNRQDLKYRDIAKLTGDATVGSAVRLMERPPTSTDDVIQRYFNYKDIKETDDYQNYVTKLKKFLSNAKDNEGRTITTTWVPQELKDTIEWYSIGGATSTDDFYSQLNNEVLFFVPEKPILSTAKVKSIGALVMSQTDLQNLKSAFYALDIQGATLTNMGGSVKKFQVIRMDNLNYITPLKDKNNKPIIIEIP